MRLDLAGSSFGDSKKESRSSLGARREIVGKKTKGLAARLPEVAMVCGRLRDVRPGGCPEEGVELPHHQIHGGDLAHTGTLVGVICHPMLQGDPNILALEGGPMSQDHILNLIHSRIAEEAAPYSRRCGHAPYRDCTFGSPTEDHGRGTIRPDS
ncbi:hypothetical protein B296_00024049 [Ensete ventricosum]|uniref:Uncharacterized protein n=1 Tax=Ensete ventricosum TaxID=4639 RepID=A0A426XUT8_ENSVE|nr:hypothetical protein B296_00024049 [Ensete ventricosum]